MSFRQGSWSACLRQRASLARATTSAVLLLCAWCSHARADDDALEPRSERSTARADARDNADAATDSLTRRDAEVTPAELAKLLARYAREPSAARVVAAALHAQRRDPQRFADMTQRARLRGLIPSLDLGVRRGQGVDLRSTTSDELGVHLTTADDLMLFATLRFDLGRLLFANEEVGIAREARFEREAQNELVRQVVHLYFLRRRLLLERDLRGGASLSHEVRIVEIEALLDGFTDGAFQRMMQTPSRAWTTDASTSASERR
jgi:hypothetical protein